MITINIEEKFIEEQIRANRTISFARCMETLHTASTKFRLAGQRHPSFLLDSKIIAHEFARDIGLNVPTMYKACVSLENIQFIPGRVIKPAYSDSAIGVFIVESESRIVYLNNNRVYTSEEAARNHARGLLSRNLVRRDEWISEDLLFSDGLIARDLKFYMFYGNVGLVLESQRQPNLRRCWYDANGQYVRTGKYENSLFEGAGDFTEARELAERISLELPTPFARIDTLADNGRIYFGEITPMPSDFDKFNHSWDCKLGEMYIDAAVRLAQDVAYGKAFGSFKNLDKSEESILAKINGAWSASAAQESVRERNRAD
jgi:hypothetical protein